MPQLILLVRITALVGVTYQEQLALILVPMRLASMLEVILALVADRSQVLHVILPIALVELNIALSIILALVADRSQGQLVILPQLMVQVT
jgi:hypothetical protein